jgi:tellurite methyltransferase
VKFDDKYADADYYWDLEPSKICFDVLKLMPPGKNVRLIDIGCGEGRNAIFFAKQGYNVTAFDISKNGIKKAEKLAIEKGVNINLFTADLLKYRLTEYFDIIFSTGTLHYIPDNLKDEIFCNYQQFTSDKGLNVFSIILKKPFIPTAPDTEPHANLWQSGEIFTVYKDWLIEFCQEEIFDCNSGGTPHKHAINRIIARKI